MTPEDDAAPAKVFCIGFHKTGTSSLAEAFEALGYRVTGPNGVDDPDIARNALPMAKQLVEQYDMFQDNPWPILFRELDELYPGSRFILTVRDTDKWLTSQQRHFGTRTTPMREWIYDGAGSPVGNEEIYRERYERHNADVLAHFADRPQDLLVMRLEDGDGWEKLAAFLGVPVPDVPFPHANSAQQRVELGNSRTVTQRVRDKLRRMTAR
ncbi:sulfotransferase [Microbacter sp. GSS18]|nr:sulfotransferase [Microbacter sp. GSS18]